VVGHVLGAIVAVVQVDRRDGSGVSLIKASDPRGELVHGLAGWKAELRYSEMVGGSPQDRHPTDSAHDDRERAWVVAREMCGDDKGAAVRLVTEAEEAAASMVDEHWGLIERIALALFNSPDGKLTATTFCELMDAE
jgi:hypothetical protein